MPTKPGSIYEFRQYQLRLGYDQASSETEIKGLHVLNDAPGVCYWFVHWHFTLPFHSIPFLQVLTSNFFCFDWVDIIIVINFCWVKKFWDYAVWYALREIILHPLMHLPPCFL